ncbi:MULTISPECIES: hypothetical protein [unclassified Haladaptatus]|uniref:hypothetical protein n=1 Tax=unclassified Haladaptatus TaxID=2622732 RepID=UPI00209C69DD|nr:MULTISPECIES: hypothetical protein [unclassified Haladaptatus]MCO8246679.1 hypothetical protein [Haladaptatus sp. AB643]MCO8256327.1 hypothetical protein [Haladaptatus sp. AB618]
MDESNRKIVAFGLLSALSSITVGVSVLGVRSAAVERWWVGIVAVFVTFVLTFAADRSRTGLRALVAIGLLTIALIVTRTIPIAVLPFVMIGMGAGTGVNRFLFGVVRAVPPLRRQREKAPAPDWYPF